MTRRRPDSTCVHVADAIVPNYRHGKRTYSCGGTVAQRWQAAYDAASLGADEGARIERNRILAHIAGKIRACEAAAAKDSGPDATGYRITLHRLTVLRDEIAAGLHVPDLRPDRPHQEEPKA